MALFGIGYKKKIEELKQHLDEQDYETAALTADDIPVHKIKSAYELNLIGKAYKCNGDFLQARKAFERSYEVRCARPVLIDIMDCCLESKDLESAEKFFDEYQKVAPEDKTTLYKYRYRIEKKKGRERRLLITILEELKALDYVEEYAYELAKHYQNRHVVQHRFRRCLWHTQSVTHGKSVFLQKQQKYCRKDNSYCKCYRFVYTEYCGKFIACGHQHTVGNDPRDGKPYFAFIV